MSFTFGCMSYLSSILSQTKMVFILDIFSQTAEILRRISKLRHSSISSNSFIRLQNANKRSKELKSALVALGRVTTSAILEGKEQ